MSGIAGLSKRGQQLYHFILRGIREGYKPTEFLELLRKQGLSYRMTDFYKDWKILSGEALRHDTMKHVPRDKVISDRLYTPAAYWAKAPYETRFYFEYVDMDTGEIRSGYTTVLHEAPMKRKDLEAIAEETIRIRAENYEGSSNIRIRKLYPVGGYKWA